MGDKSGRELRWTSFVLDVAIVDVPWPCLSVFARKIMLRKHKIYCLKGRITLIKSTKMSNKFDVHDIRFAFERGSQK